MVSKITEVSPPQRSPRVGLVGTRRPLLSGENTGMRPRRHVSTPSREHTCPQGSVCPTPVCTELHFQVAVLSSMFFTRAGKACLQRAGGRRGLRKCCGGGGLTILALLRLSPGRSPSRCPPRDRKSAGFPPPPSCELGFISPPSNVITPLTRALGGHRTLRVLTIVTVQRDRLGTGMSYVLQSVPTRPFDESPAPGAKPCHRGLSGTMGVGFVRRRLVRVRRCLGDGGERGLSVLAWHEGPRGLRGGDRHVDTLVLSLTFANRGSWACMEFSVGHSGLPRSPTPESWARKFRGAARGVEE